MDQTGDCKYKISRCSNRKILDLKDLKQPLIEYDVLSVPGINEYIIDIPFASEATIDTRYRIKIYKED